MRNRFLFRILLLATVTSLASVQSLRAQTNYVGLGANKAQWTDAANWFDGTAAVVPNLATTTAVIPAAALSGGFLPPAGGLVIGTGEAITLGTLTINSGTIIGGAGTLTVSNLNVNASGSSIDVNLLGAAVAITSTTPLNINGNITGTAAAQNFRNNSTAANVITINGNIALTSTASGVVTFSNNNAGVMVLNGVISNGGATGGVAYAGGTFLNNVDNTYTGTTVLGANSPNAVSTNIIASNGVFGTGRLQFGGGSAIKSIEAKAGSGSKTLSNEIQLQRAGRFAGTESFSLTGRVFQSNSTTLTNDITGAGKELRLSGPIFTTNSGDGRAFTLNGSGTTRLTSVVDDLYNGAGGADPAGKYGSLVYSGTGRLILDTGFSAAYSSATEVRSGTVQLGTGGAAIALNSHGIHGGATGTGTLEINHNTSLTMANAVSGVVNINHVGSGTTVMNNTSFGTGTINVTNGSFIINGGSFAGSTGAVARPSVNELLMSNADAAKLMIGQSLTVSGVAGTAAAPAPFTLSNYIVDIYVNPANAAQQLVRMSGNITTDTTTGNPTPYTFVADSGTGTGLRNVVANGGTVGGNGIIGGNLTSNAAGTFTGLGIVSPGQSIGTLTVNGNAILNGVLLIEYDGSAAGQKVDTLAVAGDVTLGNSSTLDLRMIGTPVTDLNFLTFRTLTGSFANVIGLQDGFTLSYSGGGVSITAVPEPSSVILVASIGMIGLAGYRFRRLRRKV